MRDKPIDPKPDVTCYADDVLEAKRWRRPDPVGV
jgi:hypothetical protein